MNVVVDGLMTNYLKVGKGPALIMLHGWGDSVNTFHGLADVLKNKYEIYALDLPGFGGTQRPSEAWGLDEYGIFVNNWIKKIGISGPYFLLGHSFGGSVSIVGTANQSVKPKKIVLLASAGIRGKKSFRKKVYGAGVKAARVPLYILPSAKAQKLKIKFYNRIGSDVLLVPQMRQSFIKIVSEDVRPKAVNIKVPTLLIYGSHDSDTPIADGHLLNRAIKGSRMEVVGAGHFLHHEQTEKVAKIINDFLGDK